MKSFFFAATLSMITSHATTTQAQCFNPVISDNNNNQIMAIDVSSLVDQNTDRAVVYIECA